MIDVMIQRAADAQQGIQQFIDTLRSKG